MQGITAVTEVAFYLDIARTGLGCTLPRQMYPCRWIGLELLAAPAGSNRSSNEPFHAPAKSP
jgi:hypothetical protein